MDREKEQLIPMGPLEHNLKNCFLQRPDVHERILSAEELGAYIGWMAAEFGGKVHLDPDLIADMKEQMPLGRMGRRLMIDPGDTQALSVITSGYQTQLEERYITSNHDISVARVIRYMPAHWHTDDYFAVYYANSGDCRVHFHNEVVNLRPGAVLITAPGIAHATPCYRDDTVMSYYMVRSSTFDKVFWKQIPAENLLAAFFRQALDGAKPNSYLHFETDADPDIRTLMNQIYREYTEEPLYNAQMMNTLMSVCFILLLRRYEGSVRLPRTERFFWKHEYSALLCHIQTHFAATDLPELSRQFHYSEKQIRRIVQNCTGQSFSELILRLKMERAASLLRQGYSMEGIAYTVGYTTVSSFYRAFGKYYGCTPGNYI